MSSKILVIAGMHRSGTSLISNWLHCCGLNLGNTLLGSGIGNIEGHFEDVDFLRFHEDTLEANDSSRCGFINKSISKLSIYQKEKLKGIIGFKSNISQQWGWKEPRTCLFLDHYREIIPDAYYLVIVRDFNATVSSLIRRDLRTLDDKYLSRDWFSRIIWKKLRRQKRKEKLFKTQSEFYLNIWITYNEALLNNIQSLPPNHFIVTDPNLLCDLNTTIFDKLVNKWHFSLKYADFKNVYKPTLTDKGIDIAPYIGNKKLIEKAKSLEIEIRKYA